jgi:hypothetical protein
MKRTDGRKNLTLLRDAWDAATWDGIERAMLEKSAAMTFRERMIWLEQAWETVNALQHNFEQHQMCSPKKSDRDTPQSQEPR